MYKNRTLTSPTIYISFATVYAADSCSGIGMTASATMLQLSRQLGLQWTVRHHYNTIVTISTSTNIFSLYGIGCSSTVSFNYTDFLCHACSKFHL